MQFDIVLEFGLGHSGSQHISHAGVVSKAQIMNYVSHYNIDMQFQWSVTPLWF